MIATHAQNSKIVQIRGNMYEDINIQLAKIPL